MPKREERYPLRCDAVDRLRVGIGTRSFQGSYQRMARLQSGAEQKPNVTSFDVHLLGAISKQGDPEMPFHHHHHQHRIAARTPPHLRWHPRVPVLRAQPRLAWHRLPPAACLLDDKDHNTNDMQGLLMLFIELCRDVYTSETWQDVRRRADGVGRGRSKKR